MDKGGGMMMEDREMGLHPGHGSGSGLQGGAGQVFGKGAAPFIAGPDLVWTVVLFIAAFAIYLPALGGPFVFDDLHNILYNSSLHIKSLDLNSLHDAALKPSNSSLFRPLPYLSFALQYHFNGMNPESFRLLNVFIHFLSGVFLFLFFKVTLSLRMFEGNISNPRFAAGFGALLWLVHPVQTQSVSYIVQRMNSMAGMFVILALFLYAQARASRGGPGRWLLYGACLLSWAGAVGSKEMTAVLPFFIILYEWFFFQDLSWTWLKRNLWWIAGFAAFFLIAGLAYMHFNPLEWLGNTYRSRDFTPLERVLTQLRVVVWYLSLLVLPLPSRMNLLHDFPLSRSLMDPASTLGALLVWALLLAGAAWSAKKHRLFSFAVFWFFGNLLVESSLIGLEIIYEHRLYVPSMMLALLPGLVAGRLVPKRAPAFAVMACLTAVLCVFTWQRNRLWGDGAALMEDCVAKSDCARNHYNLAHTLMLKGEPERAIQEFITALGMDEAVYASDAPMKNAARENIRLRMAESHGTLASLYAATGRTGDAIRGYEKALAIEPDAPLVMGNLGLTLAKAGRLEEAVQRLGQAIRLKPDSGELYANLADALVAQGKLEEAASGYGKALALEPESARFHDSLARVLFNLGRLDQALDHFRQAVENDPEYPGSKQAMDAVAALVGQISGLKAQIDAQP